MIFVSSFFVLGGNFLGKLSGLFKYHVKAVHDDPYLSEPKNEVQDNELNG